ncbi:MAG: hypothetical protein M3Y64_04265, partial [Gemmatimonadota bacterium]|nr:hypothetical protein [Gemmatimonadota bacterium]
MNHFQRQRITKRAERLMERAVESARASGKLDRRDFLRLGTVTLGGVLLGACNSTGPAWADRWLNTAEKQNERVERWLFSHTSMNKGSPGAIIAGNKFPSYFISDTVPKWDYAAGPWSPQITGAVKKTMKMTLADLMSVKSLRHRVDHFCVEGWTAVEILTGARMSEIARIVQPTADAHYVDFQSFD